jgi:hypothetical protein
MGKEATGLRLIKPLPNDHLQELEVSFARACNRGGVWSIARLISPFVAPPSKAQLNTGPEVGTITEKHRNNIRMNHWLNHRPSSSISYKSSLVLDAGVTSESNAVLVHCTHALVYLVRVQVERLGTVSVGKRTLQLGSENLSICAFDMLMGQIDKT